MTSGERFMHDISVTYATGVRNSLWHVARCCYAPGRVRAALYVCDIPCLLLSCRRGPAQARLMDALVFPKDSPEAQAATAAVAASEAAAAAAAAGDDSTPAAAAAASAPAVNAEQQGEGAAGEEQQQEQEQEQEQPKDPAHKATHVLIVRDPAGRILTIPYEYGKNHKTHGPNRKLWVIKLMDQLGLHQGDLLVATKEPFEFKPLAVRQQEQALQQEQPDGPWKKVLDRWVVLVSGADAAEP